MIILGVNSYHPDASAALLIDGKLIAACEEERLCRIKHFAGFPLEAVKYCLREGGVSLADVDCLALPRKPSARLVRKFYYGTRLRGLIDRRHPTSTFPK